MLYILAHLLIVVVLGLSLAHALEFPGKRRLDEATYRAIQAVYYPGFTIGGLVGEVGGRLALTIMVLSTPPAAAAFRWLAAALTLLAAVHSAHWLVTHPVNRVWLKETRVTPASRAFFGLLSAREGDWRRMRDIWEWSHVARAALAMLAFLAMTMAIIRHF